MSFSRIVYIKLFFIFLLSLHAVSADSSMGGPSSFKRSNESIFIDIAVAYRKEDSRSLRKYLMEYVNAGYDQNELFNGLAISGEDFYKHAQNAFNDKDELGYRFCMIQSIKNKYLHRLCTDENCAPLRFKLFLADFWILRYLHFPKFEENYASLPIFTSANRRDPIEGQVGEYFYDHNIFTLLEKLQSENGAICLECTFHIQIVHQLLFSENFNEPVTLEYGGIRSQKKEYRYLTVNDPDANQSLFNALQHAPSIFKGHWLICVGDDRYLGLAYSGTEIFSKRKWAELFVRNLKEDFDDLTRIFNSLSDGQQIIWGVLNCHKEWLFNADNWDFR